MNWYSFEYALGVASQGTILGVAVYVILSSIVPQWSRIWRLACGHVEPAVCALFPEPPARRPVRIIQTKLAAVGADDQPTREVA